MPGKFENVITSIETIMNKNTYSYSKVKTRLLDTELKEKENNADTEIVSNNNTSFASQNMNSQSRENEVCHGCNGREHYRYTCPSP